MTRRVLLTAGGLTLLAGCTTSSGTAAHEPDASADTRSAAPRLAVTHQAGTGQPSTGQPSTGQPSTGQPGAAKPSTAHHPGGHRAGHKDKVAGPKPPLYYIDDGHKAIALTIDDGPSPVYTPQILRLLAKYHVTASFSMIGVQVDEYRAIARDVAAAGHVIMNHTWQHLNLPALHAAAAVSQIDRATEAIHRVTGRVPAYFRAPYGAWSRPVLQHCEKAGMTAVDWSVDPRDWARPGTSYIVNNILRNTRTGSIILEHDGGGDRSQTVAALGYVIPRLLDAGYHFRAM
jgi:peptidoglycan/xylan/chitin deacetylase (PgdA/CDA1 family)